MKYLFFFFYFFFCFSGKIQSQILAFPTAEGIGKYTTGGRGTTAAPTKIFYVTSLADDGSAGTLRWALTQIATYRTIVFSVAGTIHLNSNLSIRANTTIAGQTAPAGGICIAHHSVSLGGNNIIVRYLRFRLGDKNQLKTTPTNCGVPVAPFAATCMPLNGSGGDDAFSGTGRNNVIIDHCTMSWSNDEACSIYAGDSTTIQWCMMSEPLDFSYHFETGDTNFENHGFGGIWGGKHATFHHNLFAHCKGRACRFDGSRNLGDGATTGLENCEFSNNVIYNWGAYNVNGAEGGNYNVINNYYKWGANSSNKRMIINPGKTTTLPFGKFYLSGNYVDGSTSFTNNNWLGTVPAGGTMADTSSMKVTTAFPNLNINTQAATSAYTSVLNNVGCSLPFRDTLDDRIILNVKNRTGKLIDVQGGYPHGTAYNLTTNAWPSLPKGNISLDTDQDGMPNWWETKNGLNPNLASDRATVATNGYTNVENYLNNIPAWYSHANFENFTGNRINNTQANFSFNTAWVKDSFTYTLFRSTDSLGVYTKVTDVSSSMNLISFLINDNSTLQTNAYYKIGSYRIGFTPDTLYSNIIKIQGILPVNFIHFSAKKINDKAVQLNFTTANEINVKYFLVEKSFDNIKYEALTTIAAKGFGDYFFIDNSQLSTVNGRLLTYFRIVSVDNDGKKQYSNVQKIELGIRNLKLLIYPNPSLGVININSTNTKEISIYNIYGKLIKFYNNPINSFVCKIEEAGVYIIQLKTNEGNLYFEKLIVQ